MKNHLKAQGSINITSIYAHHGPDWQIYEETDLGNPAAYSVSKGGLTQLTRWLSTTLAPEVRVNAIAPGGIFRNQPNEFVKKYVNKVPLRRMAHENDLIGAVAYLASDLSKYVTDKRLELMAAGAFSLSQIGLSNPIIIQNSEMLDNTCF